MNGPSSFPLGTPSCGSESGWVAYFGAGGFAGVAVSGFAPVALGSSAAKAESPLVNSAYIIRAGSFMYLDQGLSVRFVSFDYGRPRAGGFAPPREWEPVEAISVSHLTRGFEISVSKSGLA